MRKINSYFVFYAALLGVATIGVLLITWRFVPHVVADVHSRCESIAHSLYAQIPSPFHLALFLILGFFAVASVLRLTISLVRIARLRKRLHNGSKLPLAIIDIISKLDLQEAVYVVQNTKPYAFCFGLRKPKIYISTGLVSLANRSELEAILRHEKYHLVHRDTLTRFLAYLTQSLFPFIPVLRDVTRSCVVEQEICADREAIVGMGNERPLLQMLRKLLDRHPFALCPVPSFHTQDTLEIRIDTIIKKKSHLPKLTAKRSMMTILFVFIAAVLVAPASAQIADDHTKDIDCRGIRMCSVGCQGMDMPLSHMSFENAPGLLSSRKSP